VFLRDQAPVTITIAQVEVPLAVRLPTSRQPGTARAKSSRSPLDFSHNPGEVTTLQRMCLVFLLIVLALMATAGTAFAHIPYLPSTQSGCVYPSDPWAVGADLDPYTPPFGPFDGAAVADAAKSNICGSKGP